MKNNQLVSTISENIANARINNPFNKEVYSSEKAKGENEFLFFIKPEITLDDNKIKLNDILELILQKFEEFHFSIKSTRIVNAAYLDKHNIISQHYGVINKLSSDIRNNISEDAKMKFLDIYNTNFNTANVLGSIELINKYPYFTPTALSILWQNSPTEKLSGGTYSQKLTFDGETVFLINGFHPRQLEHFTAANRTIVVMTLISDTDWDVARYGLIGKTNPQDAAPGSIRRELLDKKETFGLDEISATWNGVHLSAGPVEGLVELLRYNSDFESGKPSKISDFQFGAKLLVNYGEEKTKKIIDNPTIEHNGKNISVFDLTEEMNSDECIKTLMCCCED